jgi:serine protease AprX
MLSFVLLLTLSWLSNPIDDKIAESLLENGLDGRHQSFLIVLRDQADVSEAYRIRGKEAKGRYVFETLTAHAARAQQEVVEILREEGAPVRSFSIVNMVLSHGDIDLIRRIADLPSVSFIAADNPVKLTDYRQEEDAALRSFDTLVWGVARIGADSVWALGYTGQGVTIGGQDTGYEWTHPALIRNYRGYDDGEVDHNYHWHDAIYEIDPLHNDSIVDPSNNPCGLQSPEPCDDNNHGTHTMGTMAGIDSTLQIGIAPDARWIGCRNMERGWGKPSTYIECFEWFMAPTDLNHENPDPAMAPHVIANSWGCPPIEGCDISNFEVMDLVVRNLKASGVVVVVSAGNSGGGGCGTVSNPAAIFESSFTVGATRDDESLAGFSSLGPVTVDNSLRLKPDLVAPGVGVRSAIRNGGYASFSGTSMAGPHVAGAVALLISARPDLAGEVDLIEELLMTTALPGYVADTCASYPGTVRPNPWYGWGRINIYQAVLAALDLVPIAHPDTRQEEVFIFPNPFGQVLHIRHEGLRGGGLFTLLDLQGRAVYRQDLPADDNGLYTLSLPDLKPGAYIWQLRSEGHLWHGKVLRH